MMRKEKCKYIFFYLGMDGLSLRGKSNSPSFPVAWMDHIAAIEEKYTLDIPRLSATASLKCHQIPSQISGTEWQQ
jgi:hypothetical protein